MVVLKEWYTTENNESSWYVWKFVHFVPKRTWLGSDYQVVTFVYFGRISKGTGDNALNPLCIVIFKYILDVSSL